MAYTFKEAQAKSPHTVRYTELIGNRGIYKDGWYALTMHQAPWEKGYRTPSFDQDKWELYSTKDDFNCAIDLAQKYPHKLKEMQATFLEEAVEHNVLPLDDRAYERFNPALAERPDIMGNRASLTVYPGMIHPPHLRKNPKQPYRGPRRRTRTQKRSRWFR